MKSKFVLHGGFTAGKTDEDNHAFYAEILRDLPDRATILLCAFAKDPDRITAAINKVKSEFEKADSGRKLSFVTADPDQFEDQVKDADAIYFHGGTTSKLLEALKRFPNLPSLLAGKTIAGESAGANVIGKYSYSKSADGVLEGLGLLPIKVIPHYSNVFAGKLDDVGKDLELVALKEYEFKVYESLDTKH